MKKKLDTKIPWWYHLFIPFMKNFYRDIPEMVHGYNFTTRVDILTHSYFCPVEFGKVKGHYNDTHTAYLWVRWRALWKDFFTMGSNTGVRWCIKKLD